MSNRHGFWSSAVRISVAAALAICATAAPPLHADDGDDDQKALEMLKNLQSLESADGDKATAEAGFTFLETFAGITGQPELTFGIKALQGVLDFTGAMSGPSASATTQALATLTANFKQLDSEVAAQGAHIDQLTSTLASKINADVKDKVNFLHGNLQKEFNALHPPTIPGQGIGQFQQLRVAGGPPAPGTTVSQAQARQIANDIMVDLDAFIISQKSLFQGEDIRRVYIDTDQKDASGNYTRKASLELAPGFKPYPALNVYLFGLQLWISAMEIESGGTGAGYQRILRDRGSNGQASYPDELKKHIAFLRAIDASGRVGGDLNGIAPQIARNVHCEWAASRYPDKTSTCTAVLTCQDHIARRAYKPGATTAWKQAGSNSFCNAAMAPTGDLESMERALQYQYGVKAMGRMADMLERVALHGTALQPTLAGDFGGKADSPFFVYGVDGLGAVKNFVGYRNQPLPKPATAGFMADIKALIPGGGTTFYAITKDGKLDWYQFTAGVGSKPYNGPVTVATGFNAYSQVFGGGDGVIYAIQPDGSLLWFRHAGFANGGGAATFTGPRAVATGWGQYKNAFSAGSGILYATQQDGSLLWFRHKEYLTGMAETTPAKSPQAGASKATNFKGTEVRPSEIRNGPTQLEGPISVASGWGGYSKLIPSGDGVVLALQGDGKLVWYRHDDYLTGSSTVSSGGAGASGNAPRPAQWATQSAAGAEHGAAAGSPTSGREAALAASWGAPGQASGNSGGAPAQRAAAVSPQWGSPPAQPRTSMNSPASMPGSLHGGAEVSPTIHPGAPLSTIAGDYRTGTGSGPKQNLAAATAMAVGTGAAHWEGPTVIDAHSGWNGLSEIAAVLPVTAHTNNIK